MAVNTGCGSNDKVISKVCKKKFNNIVLKEEQLSAVRSFALYLVKNSNVFNYNYI